MPVLFKDFDKDVKDLIEKQFGTAWKLESKFKGPKNTVFVNPQYDAKSNLTVDVQYDTEMGLKLKGNVNSALQVKPTVTFEEGANKVEVSTAGDVRELDYKVTYDLKEKGFSASAVLTKKAVDAAAVASVAHHCVVGAGITHDLSGKSALRYTLGTRFNQPGTVISALTTGFKSYSLGVVKGVKVMDKNWTVFARCNYAGQPDVTVGAQFPCFLVEGLTWKIRADNNLNVAAALTRKFADNWKASIAWETGKDNKIGLQLVRE